MINKAKLVKDVNKKVSVISTNATTVKKPSELKPWLKHFPKESRFAVMPKRTLYQTIRLICEKHPEQKAIYYYGTKIKYRSLLEYINNLASAYYGLGVRKGDMVSFLMPTIPESIYSLYALNKLGAVSNFIDPRMDIGRISDAAEGVHSKLLVTIDLAWPKVEKIMDKLTVEKIITASVNTSLPKPLALLRSMTSKTAKIPYGENILTWNDLLSAANNESIPEALFEEGSVATITYTGGTTGTPKGVMLTNDGLNTMAESFELSGVDHGENDRFLGIMPIFASYGVGCGVHMPFAMGCELIVIPSFKPEQLGGMIRRYRPNHMMGVPSFYEQIMHSPKLKNVDLRFLLTTGCGGDTMNPGLEARFNQFLKDHNAKYSLSQGYGMSEMSAAATCCFSAIYKDESAGIPLLATTVGIFDPETGDELGYGEQGEICMTGRNMMAGYHNNPEETDFVMRRHKDGKLWVHSGDIGYMDEDGFIYIKGRIKQIIIKFDGHKVFPVSIEGVINSHSAVAECAVVGIPDPNHAQGDVPLGIVELRESVKNNADLISLKKELLNICNELCEERGRPADIVFIDKMLYTPLNKHDYRKLTEVFKDYRIQPIENHLQDSNYLTEVFRIEN